MRFRSGWGSDQKRFDSKRKVSENIGFLGHEGEREGDPDSESSWGWSYAWENVGNGGPHEVIIAVVVLG